MKAAVTGASGFVGRALCATLRERGDAVTALVRSPEGAAVLPDGVEVVPGDLDDAVALRRLVDGAQVVFHLAGVRRATDGAAFMRVNADGTSRVLDAMEAAASAAGVSAGEKAGEKAAGVESTGAASGRLVLVSSIAATGPAWEGRPVTEADPLRPFEAYGESKAEAERRVRARGDRIPWTIARPSRIFGPADRENLPFFRLAARGWRLRIGGPRRPISVVDLEDVVAALLRLAEAPEAVGEAFFVSAPPAMSLEEIQSVGAEALGLTPRSLRLSPSVLGALAAVVDGVGRVTGRAMPLNRKIVRQLTAPWDCSVEKAERVLGWRPRHPPEEAVAASARWYRDAGLLPL